MTLWSRTIYSWFPINQPSRWACQWHPYQIWSSRSHHHPTCPRCILQEDTSRIPRFSHRYRPYGGRSSGSRSSIFISSSCRGLDISRRSRQASTWPSSWLLIPNLWSWRYSVTVHSVTWTSSWRTLAISRSSQIKLTGLILCWTDSREHIQPRKLGWWSLRIVCVSWSTVLKDRKRRISKLQALVSSFSGSKSSWKGHINRWSRLWSIQGWMWRMIPECRKQQGLRRYWRLGITCTHVSWTMANWLVPRQWCYLQLLLKCRQYAFACSNLFPCKLFRKV